LLTSSRIEKTELDFLLRYPIVLNVVSPVDFLSNASWGGIKALASMEQFQNLDKDIEVR
jgi:dynein heavy chain